MAEDPRQFEVVVVGAGPAGLAAAWAAAQCGKRVAVIDETPWVGGQIWRGSNARLGDPAARASLERFERCGAVWLPRTRVIAYPEPRTLLCEHEGIPRVIRWSKLVLATGARELLLPFPGWTLPNVFGAGGLLNLAKHGWPVAGKRVVIAGSGPLLLAAAEGLRKRGAAVLGMHEQAPLGRVAGFAAGLWGHPAKLWQGAKLRFALRGAPYRCGVWPVRAKGETQVREATLTDGMRTWDIGCDLLACGFGLVPNVELALGLGCGLKDGCVAVDPWQGTTIPDVFCAGEAVGIGGADCALVEGEIAGWVAGGQRAPAERLFSRRAKGNRFRANLADAFALRHELKHLATDDVVLCRCEDVTVGQLRRYTGWREAKLQSRCGMGPCQGRTCGAATRLLFGWGMESVRPPLSPAPVHYLIAEPEQDH